MPCFAKVHKMKSFHDVNGTKESTEQLNLASDRTGKFPMKAAAKGDSDTESGDDKGTNAHGPASAVVVLRTGHEANKICRISQFHFSPNLARTMTVEFQHTVHGIFHAKYMEFTWTRFS